VTPSFGKIWYRCVATVRCDRYSRSPICLSVSLGIQRVFLAARASKIPHKNATPGSARSARNR